MAIDETDLPNGTVGTEDEPSGPDAASRYLADDFRLRLDSPLFHRDPGMSAAQAPQLRELTWEHVVRPTHQPIGPDAEPLAVNEVELSLQPISLAPSPSIESLLEHARESVDPVSFHEQPEVEAAAESLTTEVPPEEPASSVEPSVPPQLASLSATFIGDELTAADLDALPLQPEWAAGRAQPARIESLLAALDQMDESESSSAAAQPEVDAPIVEVPVVPVPVVEVPVVPVPVVEVTVVDLPVVEPAVEVIAPVPARAPTASPARQVTSESRVEAELNRLAFLPDQDEEAGPVPVPAIAHSDQRPAPAALSLSQHEMYSPRQSAPVAQHRASPVELASPAIAPPRKRKKGFLGRFVKLVVVLAVLGGGLYAAKYYLLDTRWDSDVKPLVAEVEEARGLSFDHAVSVTELPAGEYATKLATSTLGITDDSATAIAGEWRALGLLNGSLAEETIGMAALPDSPAFYDPAGETIYVVEDLPPELYRFGMHRALTLALLDQQYGWSGRVNNASPSVARGTRAFYDADAVATAAALAEDAESETEIFTQIFGLYGTYEIAASPSPFATAVAGRLGVAARPYIESLQATELDGTLEERTVSDGQVLDLRRLVTGNVETPGAQARGMLYWYHVLAGRIDENTAWRAALAVQNDDVVVDSGAGDVCVVAHLQVEPAALGSVLEAFQAWAAAAPAASATTVVAAPDGAAMQIDVTACDPGPGVATTDGRGYLALGGAPLRAEQYRLLVDDDPAMLPTQVACAVYGDDSVSLADERGVVDNVDEWAAPAAHPAPDPNRLGCAPTNG